MRVPDRDTTPTGPPPRPISGGMIPMLHRPGEMTPGQLGPSSRVPGAWWRRWLTTRASSWRGMPSVMHTTRAMPASADSITAAAANRAGTSTRLASAPVAATASATVSNTGMPVDVGAALARRDAGHHLGAVGPVAQPVEPSLAAR